MSYTGKSWGEIHSLAKACIRAEKPTKKPTNQSEYIKEKFADSAFSSAFGKVVPSIAEDKSELAVGIFGELLDI